MNMEFVAIIAVLLCCIGGFVLIQKNKDKDEQ